MAKFVCQIEVSQKLPILPLAAGSATHHCNKTTPPVPHKLGHRRHGKLLLGHGIGVHKFTHSSCRYRKVEPLAILDSSSSASAIGSVASESTRGHNTNGLQQELPLQLGGHDDRAIGEEQHMHRHVAEIRDLLRGLGDGNISVSAYDTAWVAMVPALDGSGQPQFPKCLDWVLRHQFEEEGSWGHPDRFCTYDRVVSTLACVVALATWGVGAANVTQGCAFITRSIQRLAEEPKPHMPIGFEIVFPALMEDAQKLGLRLPYQSPICHKFLAERQRKLAKIPVDRLHTRASTLLFSLEGLRDVVVDWDRMLHLQCSDGSFLCSPASTACVLMHTGDPKCLHYLNSVLHQFGDAAVPDIYPVDMYERMWAVDRLQRLGIGARHFREEITACLDYVYKHWKPADGVAWARGANVVDVDDTAMGFRVLRLNGYNVSADVFLPFKRGTEFVVWPGEAGQLAVTGMFNLYRASQVVFPGEAVLEQAGAFAGAFLEEKWRTNEMSDKWIIAKDLPGEVQYALRLPFAASLPRIETRAYLDHYGVDDIWIGKSLYKMDAIHNPTFLALAKIDFNMCQRLHLQELEQLVRWDEEQGFGRLAFARQKVVECFFSAAACMHEPELADARRVWAQAGAIITVVDDYFDVGTPIQELRQFASAINSWDPSLMIDSKNETQRITFMGFYNTVNAIAADASAAQGRDISNYITALYKRWVASALVEAEWTHSRTIPVWEEYIANGKISISTEAIAVPPIFFMGEEVSDAMLEGEELEGLVHDMCFIARVLNDIRGYQREAEVGKPNSVLIRMQEHPEKSEAEVVASLRRAVDETTQHLTRQVLQPSQVSHACKLPFFHMARCCHLFYQESDGFSSLTAMKEHVTRLLFQPVA
uniref:Sandaracopimaradiene synthase n=1 Tax=Phaeoceros carolinianus TaxID=185665 RepID=A0A8U0DCB2_9EMBR|nr:sandaracopimaradiene synthase [Phaeoceros carolinianus]